MLTRRNAIRASHPIRRDVSNLTSGRFYATKGDFMGLLSDALDKYGAKLADFADCPGDEGRAMWLLYVDGVELETCVVCSWYRHGTGRYEFTVYLS